MLGQLSTGSACHTDRDIAAVAINDALKILPRGTVVVERSLQRISLSRKALATHHRMVLCRCGRMSSQATEVPFVGCVATWYWLWSSARETGSRARWASRWPLL